MCGVYTYDVALLPTGLTCLERPRPSSHPESLPPVATPAVCPPPSHSGCRPSRSPHGLSSVRPGIPPRSPIRRPTHRHGCFFDSTKFPSWRCHLVGNIGWYGSKAELVRRPGVRDTALGSRGKCREWRPGNSGHLLGRSRGTREGQGATKRRQEMDG